MRRTIRPVTAVAVILALLATLLGQAPQPAAATRGGVRPVAGGITHEVTNLEEWDAAVAAAAPGDVIRITESIDARLAYRGTHEANPGQGADGTPRAPIVITADPGVWVDPGDQNSNYGALDVHYAHHVHVVGVQVRGAQFGIRCHQCVGTALSPVRIADNVVTETGHAGIHVGGHWSLRTPSEHVRVENNTVTHTGQTAPQYGEGVYIGTGSPEWEDATSNVWVRGNDISHIGAEGVDIKPGTRGIVVSDNLIHDIAPINGGAISAHYANNTPNPNPDELDWVLIRGNKIWNQNLDGVDGANDWAIWVGHGGVRITGNRIWGMRDDASRTRAVRIRATQPFGPHEILIDHNVFWTARGWVAEGEPSGATNVVSRHNRGPVGAGNDIEVEPSSFKGPVPALGEASTADAGFGPGSAFLHRPGR